MTVSTALNATRRTTELASLAEEAKAKNAMLMTTAKDLVRIRASAAAPAGMHLQELPVELRVDDGALLDSLLAQALFVRRSIGAGRGAG